MMFRDPINDEIYPNITRAWEVFCGTVKATCWQCPLTASKTGKNLTCNDFVREYPYEAARLMGYEVVEEKTDIPLVCQHLGIEPGKPFNVRGYPNRQYPPLVYSDGQIRFYSPEGGKATKVGGRAVCWMIDHPDKVEPCMYYKETHDGGMDGVAEAFSKMAQEVEELSRTIDTTNGAIACAATDHFCEATGKEANMDKPCFTCDTGWGCTDGTSCKDTCVELKEWIEREQMDKPINNQTAKADAGKLQISLVPTQIIRDIAEVRMYGNNKYGSPDNWKSVDIKRYIDALLRHTLAFWEDPNSVDEESGILHYKHMACNMAFICEMMRWRNDQRGK